MSALPRTPRTGIALGAALLALFVVMVRQQYVPHTYLARDAAFYATMNRSIATSLTLEMTAFQPRSWYSGRYPQYRDVDQAWSNVSLGRDGRWWPKHSYLMPIASTPFYLAGGNRGLLVFTVLSLLALMLLCYELAKHWFGEAPAAVATFLFATSGIAYESVYRYSHDVFSGLLVAAFLLALVERRFRVAGVFAGLALWAKLTDVVVVGPLALAVLCEPLLRRQMPRWRDEWLPFVGFAAIPLALYGVVNTYMFGAPWITSYSRILIVVDGHPQVESASVAFDVPLRDGWRAVLGAGDGLAGMLPCAYLGAVGLLVLARRQPLVLVASLVALAGYVPAFATYRWPHTRFFFPWMPLTVVGAAALFSTLAASRPWSWLSRRVLATRKTVWLVACAAVVAACVAVIAIHDDPPRLSARVPSARVSLGDTPCDYYNPQHEQWECSRLDSADWMLSGVPGSEQCGFEGGDRRLVWAHPHSSGRPRRLAWTVPRASSATFVYGIDERSSAVEANLELWIDGRLVGHYRPGSPGVLSRVELPHGALARASNEVEVRVLAPFGDRHVCFDLRWRP